jgi:hypothetical protein
MSAEALAKIRANALTGPAEPEEQTFLEQANEMLHTAQEVVHDVFFEHVPPPPPPAFKSPRYKSAHGKAFLPMPVVAERQNNLHTTLTRDLEVAYGEYAIQVPNDGKEELPTLDMGSASAFARQTEPAFASARAPHSQALQLQESATRGSLSARPYQTPRRMAEARQLTTPGVAPRTKDWGHDALCSRRGKSYTPIQHRKTPDARQSAFHTPSLGGAFAASGHSAANCSQRQPVPSLLSKPAAGPTAPEHTPDLMGSTAPSVFVEDEREPIGISGWNGSDNEDAEDSDQDLEADANRLQSEGDESTSPNFKVAWKDLEGARHQSTAAALTAQGQAPAPDGPGEEVVDNFTAGTKKLPRAAGEQSSSVLQAIVRGLGQCCKPVLDCAEACVEDALGLDTVKRRARLMATGHVIDRGRRTRRARPRW